MQNSEATSSTRTSQSSRLVKLIYNHNPFYLISAGLVLYGIQTTFQDNGRTALDPWLLAGLLSGFITLLALTGYLIVRLGRVWDDARSIFMVILLLFFALSVSFDSHCLTSPSTAFLMLSLGFCFSALVTELILLGLQIKFPFQFRLPFYLILACTFFFPLVIAWQNNHYPNWDTRWFIGAFPLLCALSILTLIPAIRKGSSMVAKNGTPWQWPWFPFAAFVLLIVGLCGRSVLLAMAFDPSMGPGSIFGGYFLIPILFACLVVLVEIGRQEKITSIQTFGLGMFPLLIPLALNGSPDPGQATFYADITSTIGAPVWLTILAVALFFAVSSIREIKGAATLLVCAMIAVAFTTPTGHLASSLAEVSVWPCVVLSLLQLRTAKRRAQSWNWLIAMSWLAPLIGLLSQPLGQPELRIALAGHWILLAACVIGFRFQDRFAMQLRVLFALVIPTLAMASLIYWLATNQPGWTQVAYVGCLLLFNFAIYRLSSDKLFAWTSSLTLGIGILSILWQIRERIELETEGLAGFLLLSILFFAIGVFVSCLKAGLRLKLIKAFNRMVIDVQERFHISESLLEAKEN